METVKHIAFSVRDDSLLVDYLTQSGIPFHQTKNHHTATFDINISNPHWNWISDYIEKHHLLCLSNIQFTKNELSEAQWLNVRCIWRFGYPEPSDKYKYKSITYTNEKVCAECGAGLVQQNSFRFKTPPSWGKRHFYAPFWIEDELFVSDRVKNVLSNAEVHNVSFMTVLKKNGREVLEGVHQLVIPTVLEKGLIEEDSFLKKISVCSKCGTKKYCGNGCGPLIMHKEVFEGAPDMVKTEEVFGGMPGIAGRKILISQKVYRILVDNQLDSSLQFYPVELR